MRDIGYRATMTFLIITNFIKFNFAQKMIYNWLSLYVNYNAYVILYTITLYDYNNNILVSNTILLFYTIKLLDGNLMNSHL